MSDYALGNITVILGRRGDGKSCYMTYLGYEDHLAGIPVIANYHLNFPYTYMTFEEIARLPKSLKDCVVLLDEGQVGADSREIFKASNKSLTTLATQLRKRNINVYITTQIFGQMDKRLRDQTDTLVYMRKIEKINTKWFKYFIEDWQTQELIKDWTIFHGEPYFGLYDTNEVIRFSDEEDEDDEISAQMELIEDNDLNVT